MMESKTLEFWNKCHIDKNGMGLTGSPFDDTIKFLKIEKFLKPSMKVLEVGVGMGFTLRGFYEIGVETSGVDVSDIALNCVRDFCKHTYIVDEMNNLPSDYYDLIIYYNVVQHIYTSTLMFEFEQCMRALKTDGLMAIQFVSTPNIEDSGLNSNYNVGQSFFRSKNYMTNMIKSLGGESILVYDSIRFYSPNWLKESNNSGYGKIEYSSEYVTIPLPCNERIDDITGNHVFHIRKNKN